MNKVKTQMEAPELNHSLTPRTLGRRAFLGRMAVGAALLAPGAALFAKNNGKDKGKGPGPTKGEAALLRFAAAAEILETDFGVQANELHGLTDSAEADAN